MIIRRGCAADTARLNATEKTVDSDTHAQRPQVAPPPKPGANDRKQVGGRRLINRPAARNLIEIRTSAQRGGSVIRELFLGREFLINREVPSSAYLQRASVAVDADWQGQSRDSHEVMCRSAGRRASDGGPTSPGPTQLPLTHHYAMGERSREGREKGVRPPLMSSRTIGSLDALESNHEDVKIGHYELERSYPRKFSLWDLGNRLPSLDPGYARSRILRLSVRDIKRR